MAIPLSVTAPAAMQALRVCVDPGDGCAECRRTGLRLVALERSNEVLRRDAALAARRLQLAVEQLAAAQRLNRSAAPGDEAAAPCGDAAAPRLGRRERQVLRLIAEGQRTPSIATRLGITGATVEVHRRNIMRKLGLHSVAQLTRYAVREGISAL